ncbi:UvrD-helicase domain-containing protein [Cyanobacterium aponinum AL20118]|uniref:DNA 3'-5' helicase n=1 Tax=Cyanobacterium aponinum AL20115 TaxID=3090662 RepID=A0AAF0ZBX7_9CHRO|nr:UvrD-helicase domain-containing protein [Cyanobacterium aponinum]WPF87365.1 UvrD-helicase domain-containing protein [Cyanobacterium aponinum AL20115]
MWQITFTSNFLESLNVCPLPVQKKFPELMRFLENDPSPRNGCSIKLDNRQLWRIPLTRKYRLFYQYSDNWVKLIEISQRNEGTYKTINLDKLEEEEISDTRIPDWFIDDIEPEERYQFTWFKEQDLKTANIPQIYWQRLMEIAQEKDSENYQDQLIDYIDTHITDNEEKERVFNCCVTKTINQLEHQTGYVAEELTAEDFLEQYLVGNKHFYDLVLNLSKEQKRILELPLDKPILVKGGAGTGKTILAIHKVAQIAKHHYQQGDNIKVLFTTYTPSLVNYVKQLLIPLLGTNNLEKFGVEVYAVDDLATKYCRSQYSYIPEIIDREKSLILLSDAIACVDIPEKAKQKINSLGANSFLLEEFIYYIEARGIKNAEEYRQLRSRTNDVKSLTKHIWNIYQAWKEKISFAGYITVDTLRNQAEQIVSQLGIQAPYYYLVIDEAQDLSPIALKFLASLVNNSCQVFITADINQSLYQRSCGWSHIEVSFNQYRLHSKTLTRSFRNTKQIGKGCQSILSSNSSEIITNFSDTLGDKPNIILTDNDLKIISKIKDFYNYNKKKYSFSSSAGVVLTPDSNYSQIITRQLNINNVKAEYIQPENIDIKNNFIQVLDLNSIKGLEFPFVVIIGLKEDLFPRYPFNILEEDKKEIIEQQRKLFYVGCSRAIYSLLVIGGKSKPSTFLYPLIKDKKYWKTEVI